MTVAIRLFLFAHPNLTVSLLVGLLLVLAYRIGWRTWLQKAAATAVVLYAAFAVFTFHYGCRYSYPVVKGMIAGHYVVHAQIESGGGDGAGGGSESLPDCSCGPQGAEWLCTACQSDRCQRWEFGCCFLWLGPCTSVGEPIR